MNDKVADIILRLVNRHKELKDPLTKEYGQDDELFNLLDDLEQTLK